MFGRILLWMAGLNALFGFLCAAAERQLISAGWDSPNAAEFREGLGEFEKWEVFDGATIVPTRRVNDSVVISFAAFSTNRWAWSEFAECVADLAAARPQRCTNNFLMLTANPGYVGWFDDAGWAEVVEHWRLLARVARKGGLKGLAFDPEAYEKPGAQFSYAAQGEKERRGFAEMSAKTRERGRAVMKAVAEEFPEITIFAYRLFSDLLRSGDPHKARVGLETSAYGLLPAFVDGWFDVMPPGVTIIDGNETAYVYENEHDYGLAFARLKIEGADFLSVENRAKFRGQFRVGHGVYLDGYVPAPAAKTFVDLKGDAPPDRLVNFVSSALRAADGVVWIYGENARWWPHQKARPLWTEKFPGVESALRAAKNPVAFAKTFLSDAEGEANLLGALTNGWAAWQQVDSKGAATFTNGMVRLAGMENGTMSQTVPVKPGQSYAVGARGKTTGVGEFGIAIGWHGADGKWIAANRRVEFTASEPADSDGWRSIAGLVHVPAGAERLVFLLFARGQGAGSEVIFADSKVVRVAPGSRAKAVASD